ncbi:MAG: hypothetical protein PHV34_17860 [Verrucomicrobiae bacterium]|nr:hypothetical protein [Verrucomicrobiae bacterium]
MKWKLTSSTKRALWSGVGIYMGLWTITGTLGLLQVDRAFDEEFALGSPVALTSPSPPIQKVPTSRVHYARITDPGGKTSLPGIPFRSRSIGIPVGPFLILDEVCVATTPMAAFSGRRLVFWFFGYTGWMPLKTWWTA